MTFRRALIKWTIITVLCGVHSFFWGAMANASIPAMLGVATLILMFARIDSHPRFQAKRLANPSLKRALDIGINIRIALAFYIGGIYLLMAMGNKMNMASGMLQFVLYLPYMGELYIGMYSMKFVGFLSGAPMDQLEFNRQHDMAYGEYLTTTYLTTLTTGLAHTLVLGLICFMMYLTLKFRRKTA